MKMKFILMAFAAAGLIGSATLALADSRFRRRRQRGSRQR